MLTKEEANIVAEAAKLRKDYPRLSIREAIEVAKEILEGGKINAK